MIADEGLNALNGFVQYKIKELIELYSEKLVPTFALSINVKL